MKATYSPDDNKLRLYASSRLDADLYARVKAAGFKWAPKQDLFVAPMWTPGRVDLLEELAGEIGDEDTSLTERAEERAERFADYSDKRAKDAESAHKHVSSITDNIPLGQPILIGHHSEKHARRDAEKIENGMRRAVKMWETSKYWQQRAAGALANAQYKERADVRARRIKGIEADKRQQEKYKQKAADSLKMWEAVNTPEKWKKRSDGSAPTKEQLAVYAANLCSFSAKLRDNGSYWSAWDVLRPDGERHTDCPSFTVDEVIEAARRAYSRTIAHCNRWIQHYENRLTYERALLDESGYIMPPKNPTRAALPILNYSGEVQYKDRYNRGQVLTTQAHGMTRAEYASINKNYKGTFISSDGTHRIRSAIVGSGNSRGLAAVYLTDSKQHPKPTGAIPETREQQKVAERIAKGTAQIDHAVNTHRTIAAHNKAVIRGDLQPAPKREPEAPTAFDAMRETLKAGVQVVTAPQLFPTPPHLAERMAELADIQPAHRILEPSAGTGNLIKAVLKGQNEGLQVVAVEINSNLAMQLSINGLASEVENGDFLQCNGNLGKFDRIIMNPPFANGADVKHIQHALTFLKPGGRLVAICANGSRQNALLQPAADTWEPLPPGTFANTGTGVNTVLLTITT